MQCFRRVWEGWLLALCVHHIYIYTLCVCLCVFLVLRVRCVFIIFLNERVDLTQECSMARCTLLYSCASFFELAGVFVTGFVCGSPIRFRT